MVSEGVILHPKPEPVKPWQEFDKEGYMKKGALKEGEDKYAANKFNQEASDALPADRNIQDSREKASVRCETRLK